MLSKTITVILIVILLAPIVLTSNSARTNVQFVKAQLVKTSQSMSSQPPQKPNIGPTPTTIVIPAGGGLRILNQYYQPLAATVVNGSTVVWRNDDTAPHTATSGIGPSDTNKGKVFDTGIIPTGSSSKASTINGRGDVNYFCSIHPWMVGIITVISSPPGAVSSAAVRTTITTPLITVAAKQQELPLPQPLNQMLSQDKPITTYFNEISNAKTSLPKSTAVTLGTERANNNDWITASHDIFGTRSSNQTAIGKNNVNKLEAKWVLNTPNMVENSPIIIGDRGYVQDNDGAVYAFNATTGQNLWKDLIGTGGLMHGLTYNQNVLFVGSGRNATVLAINATDGKKIWESPTLGPKTLGYGVATPPVVWKDYVVVRICRWRLSSISWSYTRKYYST